MLNIEGNMFYYINLRFLNWDLMIIGWKNIQKLETLQTTGKGNT
jgi:uncharacterized membrane-anchored protein YitT (DUF2179 family)